MTSPVIRPGRQANCQARADVAPMIGRSVFGPKTEPLDDVDRTKNGLDLRPAAEIEQDFRARGDEGVRGEGLARLNGAQYGDAGVDRSVLAGPPPDEREDRASFEIQQPSPPVNDVLGDWPAKPDPALDLTFQPQKIDLSGHRTAHLPARALAVKAGATAVWRLAAGTTWALGSLVELRTPRCDQACRSARV